MNIKDFKDSLDYLFKSQITPFVWGHAGIGKTTVVKQYAKDKGFKFFALYLGTQSDIGDILGLASFVKDKNGSEIATQFATPIWLKETVDYCNENPQSGAVIFLDEFNRARRDILNGMFSLALDKTFHTNKLPSNCYVIAAGNPPTDEYYVTDVNETALMARFAHIKLEPTFDEWYDYAKDSGFNPDILSFLKGQPNLLEDSKSTFDLPVKVDRRSYERLNRLLTINTPQHLFEQLAAGIIGMERLVSFKQHLNTVDKPLHPSEVLDGTRFDKLKEWSNPKDVKASLVSITCDNLIEYMNGKDVEFNKKQSDNFVEFIDIIPKDMCFAFLKKLVKEENQVFKCISTNKNYEKKIVAILKEAKGIAK